MAQTFYKFASSPAIRSNTKVKKKRCPEFATQDLQTLNLK